MNAMTLNIRGQLVRYDRPVVMGILNVTPDSFFAGSRVGDEEAVRRRVSEMVAEGVDIIDIGACSTRPGSPSVAEDMETERLRMGMKALREVASDIIVSVDTFRPRVAVAAVREMGCDIVNDIAGTAVNPEMVEAVAGLGCPYILMHSRGTPETMQTLTDYPEGVTAGVIAEMARAIDAFALAGVSDIIIDPGFGFAKTLDQNYELFRDLRAFEVFHLPVLVGISRKSMLTKLLGITSDEALEATTALNAFALDRGAAILRVHDVRAARQAVEIYSRLQ